MQTLKVVDSRYQIKARILGRGSYGEVYLCYDTKDSNLKACKMISKQKIVQRINRSESKQEIKEFLIDSLRREVDVMKKLSHKNILKFFDISETENNIYFFTEYCSRGNLEDYVQKKGKLSSMECFSIIEQLLDACLHLQQKGIVHRDIKPLNIFLGQGLSNLNTDGVKLGDFGFAVDVNSSNLLVETFKVGTSLYMAPEMAEKCQSGFKSDVWCLGVTFYFLLFGSLPWPQTDQIEDWKFMRSHLQFPVNVDSSLHLKMIIKRMLTWDVNKRASIHEIRQLFLKGK